MYIGEKEKIIMEQASNTIKWIVGCICLLVVMPAIAQAGVFNDAYSYKDDFENDTGLNLVETYGVTVENQVLEMVEASAVAVSQCITLPQPEGGIYVERYGLALPGALRPGRYTLKFKLYSRDDEKNVFVALDPALLDEADYYRVADVDIVR